MVDLPEPETPITTIAAGSGRAASFVVPAGIDINSSVWARRPLDQCGRTAQTLRLRLYGPQPARLAAGRFSELVAVVNGWEASRANATAGFAPLLSRER
jgi:hypothetical protein